MNSRPATFEDFFGHEPDPKSSHTDTTTHSIVRGNIEFGAKKFIKP